MQSTDKTNLLDFAADLEEMADQVTRAVNGDPAARRWLAGYTDGQGRISLEAYAPDWTDLDAEAVPA